MEIQLNQITPSPSSSSSSSNPKNPNFSTTNPNPNPMQSWWESISKARSRIQILSTILPPASSSISSLADSDRPARSLLESQDAYLSISSSLSSPSSGSGDDPLCQWLYETFQSSDLELRLIVLSFLPLLSGIYLSRIVENPNNPSLAGFEAVLLAVYASEAKGRAGKPLLISLPDLSVPSLYHSVRRNVKGNNLHPSNGSSGQTKVLCPPLEPQVAVKSTKRAFIVAVTLDCYYKQISQMPSWSKFDLCRFAATWAGQNCPCRSEFDKNDEGNGNGNGNVCEIRDFGEENEIEEVVEGMHKLGFGENCLESGISVSGGARIPLPWELLQPVLRILGHCLFAPLNSQDVRDVAAYAVRCLYARASHELVPEAILATRSLIQLDKRARLSAKTAAAANASSNANTPSKAKKPEILLASK